MSVNCLTEEGHSLAEGLTLASVSGGEALLQPVWGGTAALQLAQGGPKLISHISESRCRDLHTYFSGSFQNQICPGGRLSFAHVWGPGQVG